MTRLLASRGGSTGAGREGFEISNFKRKDPGLVASHLCVNPPVGRTGGVERQKKFMRSAIIGELAAKVLKVVRVVDRGPVDSFDHTRFGEGRIADGVPTDRPQQIEVRFQPAGCQVGMVNRCADRCRPRATRGGPCTASSQGCLQKGGWVRRQAPTRALACPFPVTLPPSSGMAE